MLMQRSDPLRVGVHVHEYPEANPAEFRKLDLPSCTVLDIDANYYIPIVEADNPRKDTIYTVRLYTSDQPGRVPEEVAGAVIALDNDLRNRFGSDLVSRVYYQKYNEINLGIEWGGNDGLQAWLETEDGFKQRADRHLRAARSLKDRAPNIKIAGPFDSPGHQDVDGRQEIRLLCQMGYFDLVDMAGFHFYAEGPDRGGFDAEDRKYYSDRVFDACDILDQEGYSNLVRGIGECNRKDILVGDYLGEFDRYCGRLSGVVQRVDHFEWSSGNAAFKSFRLADLSDVGNRYMQIVKKYYYGFTPPIVEPPKPKPEEVPIVNTDLIITIEGKVATLDQAKQKYPGLEIHDSATVVVAQLLEMFDGQTMMYAYGPPDKRVELYPTNDGPNSVNARHGNGHAEVEYTHDSQAQKADAIGPWTAECDGDKGKETGAYVKGLGMAWLTNHNHFTVTFANRQTPVIEPPVTEPPVIDLVNDPDFQEQRTYPEWAMARIVKGEDHRDVEAFKAHLTALGKPEPNNPYKYGWFTR